MLFVEASLISESLSTIFSFILAVFCSRFLITSSSSCRLGIAKPPYTRSLGYCLKEHKLKALVTLGQRQNMSVLFSFQQFLFNIVDPRDGDREVRRFADLN